MISVAVFPSNNYDKPGFTTMPEGTYYDASDSAVHMPYLWL